MSNLVEYNDITAFHPGYYVSEIIEDMRVSKSEFALRLGTTVKTLEMLINGQISISNDLAKKLSIMLGTGIDVWLNLQNSFDKTMLEIQTAKEFDRYRLDKCYQTVSA